MKEISVLRKFQSLLAVAEDLFFDYRFGVKTSEVIEVRSLDISDQDKEHAVRYKPTRARYFRKLLEHWPLPKSTIFVDVGCGLGRVVVMASMQGFEQTIGLELSPRLAEGAIRNLAIIRQRFPNAGKTEIVCTNVLDHEFSHDENVFFLFWPFDRTITERFNAVIKDSLKKSPRPITLIINEFQFRDLLESDPTFKLEKRVVYGAAEFDIYTSSESDFPQP